MDKIIKESTLRKQNKKINKKRETNKLKKMV
jgi:hypothetical protein